MCGCGGDGDCLHPNPNMKMSSAIGRYMWQTTYNWAPPLLFLLSLSLLHPWPLTTLATAIISRRLFFFQFVVADVVVVSFLCFFTLYIVSSVLHVIIIIFIIGRGVVSRVASSRVESNQVELSRRLFCSHSQNMIIIAVRHTTVSR